MKIKRGISPVISAVLLIAIVIAMAAGVFVWTRNYTSKAGQEASEQKLCSETVFRIRDFCHEDKETYDADATTDAEKDKSSTILKFNVRNENPYKEISGFLVSLEYNSGDTQQFSPMLNNEVPTQDVRQLVTGCIPNTQELKQIRFIPEIKTDKKTVTCSGEGVSVPWGEVGECQ